MESCPMNEFGEPNMGNPSVRFDEGRKSVGHWPCASQSILSRLLYKTEEESPFSRFPPVQFFVPTNLWQNKTISSHASNPSRSGMTSSRPPSSPPPPPLASSPPIACRA